MQFISKYRKHLVVLVPARHIYDNLGIRRYQAGKSAQFEDFRFDTEDPEMIKLLKESPWYNVDFRAVGDNKPMAVQSRLLADEEKESAENTLTSCPYCPFKSKTLFGIKAHMRIKHAGR